MRSITFTGTGTGTSTGSSDTSYSLSYDQNGNLTQKQNQLEPNDKTTYAWDANNRLIQMNQSKTISSNIGTGTGSAGTAGTSTTVLSASFSYDAFGRRIQSTITQGSQAPNTVQYLYEGAQALGEIRDGKLSHRLLTGLSLDETIARIAVNGDGNKDAANSRLYLTDALNSVIAQLADDDNANIQNSYGYSPYGQSQTVGPDSANNPNQYTSRENDNTGLYYYRARYYDPVLKRFVSSDPIGLAGGMNTYSYVEGNPLSYADPTGEIINLPGIAIGVGMEVAMQAYKNYSDDCDLLDIDNYDLWNIGVAGAVGAFVPGMGNAAKGLWPKWAPLVGKSRGPGGAIKELLGQLDRANTANRVAKVASRIEKNGLVVADNLTYNAAYQAGKKAISNGSGNRDCTCQR
jgi:RHS repeat-associated protein